MKLSESVEKIVKEDRFNRLMNNADLFGRANIILDKYSCKKCIGSDEKFIKGNETSLIYTLKSTEVMREIIEIMESE